VTNELPLGVLCCSALRALALLGYGSAELPTSLSSDPAFGELTRRVYRQYDGATSPKVCKNIARLLLCRCDGIEIWDSTVQAGVQPGN
jgi:hypothetical protein